MIVFVLLFSFVYFSFSFFFLELSHSHVRCELAPVLDNCESSMNAIALARVMDFNEDNISFLESCYYGGGNPATEFLTTLIAEQPDLKVTQLRECLLTEGIPEGAVNVISNYSDSATIDDISPLHVDALARKLATRQQIARDWEYVAEQFGLGDKIPIFKMSLRRNNMNSPTAALIDLIRTQRPGTKVKKLIEGLELIGNEKVEKLLKDQVDKQCS